MLIQSYHFLCVINKIQVTMTGLRIYVLKYANAKVLFMSYFWYSEVRLWWLRMKFSQCDYQLIDIVSVYSAYKFNNRVEVSLVL
jgi:hypothetical protein